MTDEQEPEDDSTKYFISGDGTFHFPMITWTSVNPTTYTSTVTSNMAFPSRPILFGQWLAETLKLQTEFYKDISNLPQAELEDWMRVNAFAAEDEIHEAMNEISWKPWAKSEFFNRDAFIGECVDALHFVGNMLAAAKCTDGELNAAYVEKMERNRKRQRQGYTGLDKCSKCGRAADDIKAHGGYMKDFVADADHPTVHSTGYGCNSCFCDSGDDWK